MSKISIDDFQQMLRNRKAPTSGRGRPQGKRESSVPKWKVDRQLRGSYFRPADNAPTRIRLMPQNNGELFYEYYSKWVKVNNRNVQVYSNAWNGIRPLPCLLLDKYDEVRDREGDNSPAAEAYKADRKFAMSVVVLEDFYVEEVQRGKNTYTNYIQAPTPNRHGNVVDDPKYANCEKVFGRVLHWSMYNRQKESFLKQLEEKLSICMNCKEGHIDSLAFSCANCDHTFLDVRTDHVPEDEIAFLKSGKNVQCDECGHIAPPKVVKECIVQKGYGSSARYEKGCDNPTLIDPTKPIDLVIRKVPAGNSFTIEILDIDIPEHIPRLQEVQQNPEIRTDMPLDFDRFLGQMSLRDQAFSLLGSADACPYDESVQNLIDQFFEAKSDEEDLDSIPF